jgi:hypothetical protein
MKILNTRNCFVAAVILLTSCGRQERLEAVRFAKVLTEKQSNLAAADAIEKELVANARAWSGGITAYGSGRGETLNQNAIVAAELAKSAVAASAQLSAIRQAIDSQALQEEYPRSVRNELTRHLTRRQRTLQDIRALLEDSATQFRQYKQSTKFTGEAYPESLGKLVSLLAPYQLPEDAVAGALFALKSKYGFGEKEI